MTPGRGRSATLAGDDATARQRAGGSPGAPEDAELRPAARPRRRSSACRCRRVAYGFLWLVSELQDALFTDLPDTLGYDAAPTWWPMPVLAVGGLLDGAGDPAAARAPAGTRPPTASSRPARSPPVELPGVVLAALATLSFGAVLGPEAPLIAIGSGLGVLAVRLAARDAPPMAATVIAAAGSFAAISALLGSPLLGAFLLLEASGLGGPMLGVVLVPGLLAAGIGTLIFIGLDSITGLGTFSLALPDLPPFDRPTVAMFGWAIVIGLVAPFLGLRHPRLALALRPVVERAHAVLLPLVGIASARSRPASPRSPTTPSPTSCSPGRTSSRAGRPGGRVVRRRAAAARRLQGRWPTRCRSARSAAARCSRRCSSAPPAASPRRTCPGSSSSRRWRWASARCPR